MTQEANTVILQILLLAAAVGALVYFVRSGQSVGVRASKRIAFGAFIVLNIYAVLRPNDLTYLARAVGIGRGTDLLVYLLVVAFVFGMLNTYLRDREISQHLTNLARQIAVRDAELTRRESELEQRLTALEERAAGTNGHRAAVTEPAADEVGTARSTRS
ncbi:putative membrane protein [Pseudonocardia sp. Ae406_Ps2]|uniref:DUF2304 domain-containing protein n=1 Tax=unclassified Pseudonocardia TaxID=2619320 RepID=UPI0005C28A25|nr:MULTISPECIES: DUF2304 domain-containing protein [unclassified Pseudonocardia]OLL98583.1 putative membrane protein [Pseudonocardia sp. Ae331_Ps2]OLM03689.1 putative membrane protein [Pseudonocardia sp. Ae406_Ps2]OLM11453.1 putative membrane protein [Pseudonocardia sp. Ae505_Ps2]OLM34559.1 putative membrane protein [Pseudonocardia sp. Ae717_Ps2]OLM25248.1 putative membrane protein [Pseudonocardia sp. Ae706_Ps2]